MVASSHESRVTRRDRPLAGKGIVVTRPAHQAEGLAALIRAAGGDAILYPALEILDVEDPRPVQALIERLDEFHIAIFVSPNAVAKAMGLIAARRALPPALVVAAVGSATGRALARLGVTGVIVPHARADSEALLELPQLGDVAGRRVVIFRGQGGRELLGDTLRARGARVEYAECYRRARPAADAAPLRAAWRRGGLHAVIVTSSEGLAHLLEMMDAQSRERLAGTPLFVPHPRIAQNARDRGMGCVVVTRPGDEGIVEGLVQYFKDVTTDD